MQYFTPESIYINANKLIKISTISTNTIIKLNENKYFFAIMLLRFSPDV